MGLETRLYKEMDLFGCKNQGIPKEAASRNQEEIMPKLKTINEIKSLSLDARHFIQDVWRNHAQVIAGHAEERTDNTLPHPVRERLKAISEAVQTMSEDMRRIGL